MKSIFRATAILSSSSIISIFLSLITAKVLALYLQPEGYGYYGLLQSFVAVSSLVAGLGIPTGIVRMGASAAKRGDFETLANLRIASWLLFSVLGVVALVLIAVFRVRLSVLVLDTPARGGTILLMSLALLFTVAANIQVGTLNAYHRVKALAKYAVANTVLGAAVGIGAVLIWRVQGIAVAVIGGAIVTLVVSSYFLRREISPANVRMSRQGTLKAARYLVRFGGPYTASMFVGSGVQLTIPILVLHLLSPESVGYYRAAAGISVGYLGFLITAMGQDYYPRVSAAADKPVELVELINAQHRLVMLLAVPMILGTLAVVPYLVPLVYTLKFRPTVEILEWQLIGDIFKFASWTMSFAILARSASSVFFLIELTGGVVTLLSTWISVRLFGLTGLGISFLVTYVIYYFVVWAVIRREVPLVWSKSNQRMLIAGIAAAIVVRILPSTRFGALRTPVALALALAAGIPSLVVVWREFKGKRNVLGETAIRAEESVVEV